MRTLILTTRQGRMIVCHKKHQHFRSIPSWQHLLEEIQKHNQDVDPFITEIQRATFIVRKKILPFRLLPICHLWIAQDCPTILYLYQLKKIISHHTDPALITSQDGTILYANKVLCTLLHHTASALQGRSFSECFIEPPVGNINLYKKIYKMKDHQGRGVEIMISHVMTDENYVAFFLMPVHKNQAHLAQTTLLDQLPLAAALMDENGGILQMNALLKNKISTPYRTLNQWIVETDRYNFAQLLRRLRRTPRDMSHTRIHTRAQPQAPLSVFLQNTTHSETGLAPFIAIFLESDFLLPTKEAEPQKMQILGQLASGIMHDFNNLLTGILGFCDLLLQRHDIDDPSFKDIQQIKQSAVRAVRLIQQLLTFSKPTPLCHSPLSIKQCLKDLSSLMHRMMGPKILLTIEEKIEDSFMILGDLGQLEQILLNLAINARDAMAQGGLLTFTLNMKTIKSKFPVIKGILSPQRYVVVTIKDTGTGIDAQDANHIFDPFFSTKEPGQGTGLGLSNVLQIMEALKGGMTMETQPGKGTSFSLYFPAHQGYQMPQEHAMESMCEVLSGTAARILLVEDEDPVRLFTARALREKGHEVLEARDGAQALEMIQKKHDIHIMITDVMMPGVDGPSLAASIRQKIPSIKVLFVSGYPEEQVRGYLPKSSECIYFLAKPFMLADVVNKVQEILASSGTVYLTAQNS